MEDCRTLSHILQKRAVPSVGFVHIRLAGNLPRRVHAQDGHTAVDHFHAVLGQYVGNGTAAACVDLTHLRHLEAHMIVIEYPAQLCDILRVGVIGAALSA